MEIFLNRNKKKFVYLLHLHVILIALSAHVCRRLSLFVTFLLKFSLILFESTSSLTLMRFSSLLQKMNTFHFSHNEKCAQLKRRNYIFY